METLTIIKGIAAVTLLASAITILIFTACGYCVTKVGEVLGDSYKDQ